jgi:hypothetical protein
MQMDPRIFLRSVNRPRICGISMNQQTLQIIEQSKGWIKQKYLYLGNKQHWCLASWLGDLKYPHVNPLRLIKISVCIISLDSDPHSILHASSSQQNISISLDFVYNT